MPGLLIEICERIYLTQEIDVVGSPQEVCIGGKSMGGRQASLLADELEVKGLICLGFPFHATGQIGNRLRPHRRATG
jgi:predicted alpha/beta-hydrolase family hydrolase